MRQVFQRGALLVAGLVCSSPGAFASGIAPDSDKVIASRGTAGITLGELDARMEEVPPDRRAGLMDSPERIDTMLQQMLLVEQLADEALAEGLDKDPRIERQLDLARKRLLTQLRIEQLRKIAEGTVDMDTLARERYAANRASYVVPESRTARHVLVSTKERSEQDARARIDALAKRLSAGESLEALAREASDDAGTRADGGLIPDILAGATDPAFDAALQNLEQPGAITPEPVLSQFGWHLIELVSINAGRQKSYDEVRDQLLAEIQVTNVERQVRSHTDALNSLPIDADPEVVASLRTRYQTPVATPPPAAAAETGSRQP
jgi:peptidyl-prolyl cis-trans isomerase C